MFSSFIALVCSVLSQGSGLSLSKEDLKVFRSDFKILSDAYHAGETKIVAKYGSQVVDKNDLIRVMFDTSRLERIQYDSVRLWVSEVQKFNERQALLGRLSSSSPSQKASIIAELYRGQNGTPNVELTSELVKQVQKLEHTSLDTMFSLLQILPQELSEHSSLQKKFNREAGILWNNAKNQDEAAIIQFARRFPGFKDVELNSAIQSMRMDETSLLIKNPTNRNLIQLYKTLEAGKQKVVIKQKLEKAMYGAWKECQDPEEAMQAAKDFIEVFKEEVRKSAKYKEIEEWMNPTAIQPGNEVQQSQSIAPIVPSLVRAN